MKMLKRLMDLVLVACGIYLVYAALTPASGAGVITGGLASEKPKPVKGIVSLCKPVPFIIMGLDGGDKRLIGINAQTQLSMQSNILSKYFPNTQKISGNVCDNAFKPNIEELIKLKPGLIVDWQMFTEDLAQMQSFGFHVLGLEYDGSERSDREMVTQLAFEMGREDRVDSLMRLRDKTLRGLHAVTDTIPFNKRPKMIYLYSYENMTIEGEKSFEHFSMQLAGGRDMGAGLGLQRSMNIEQILVWNPDIILLNGWRSDTTPNDLYQNPILQGLSAVKKRQVIKMPVWSSNESPLSWMWLADIIQPEHFHFNIRQQLRQSYKWQYVINLTSADIDEVLFCKDNAASTLYKQMSHE